MPRKKPGEPPKKRGRPPKVQQRRSGRAKGLPDSEIQDIKSMAAAVRVEVLEACPMCAKKKETREKIEAALLAVTAGMVTEEGDSNIGQVAGRWRISAEVLLAHRDKCMKHDAVLTLEKKGTGDIENSAAWISKLAKYLEVVDGVIAREEAQPEPDPRVLLDSADKGRKICETNARLFLDLWKLRIDQKVQDDFMRIVLEVVDHVAPLAKERIIEKLKGRLALATASGIGGVR